jgi:hypothetical protein
VARTIIVPSASAVVLLGIYGMVSLVKACDPDVGKQQHVPGSVDKGGVIKDYVPANPEPAVSKK